MKTDIHEPCPSCPYRKDAELARWHRNHFLDLLDNNHLFGACYGCHGTAKQETPSFCAGWMLDQLSRGIPNINLRLFLSELGREQPELDFDAFFAQFTGGGNELYESIEEMCEVNLNRDNLLREMGVIIDEEE